MGFRDKRSRIDLALLLHYHIKSSNMKFKPNNKSCVVFLDILGSFYTVDTKLLRKNPGRLLLYNLLTILKSLFIQNYIKVVLENFLSRTIRLRRVVLQASILSTFLYLVFIDDIKINHHMLKIILHQKLLVLII